jgi:hypothetical protein
MNHGKLDLNCCVIDYYLHTIETNMLLLISSIYFSIREHIRDHSTLVLPKMIRCLHRILPHIYYNHRKLFDSLQFRYRIVERLTLYCKKFKAIDNPKEYCINL